jgi:hypothetical protein
VILCMGELKISSQKKETMSKRGDCTCVNILTMAMLDITWHQDNSCKICKAKLLYVISVFFLRDLGKRGDYSRVNIIMAVLDITWHWDNSCKILQSKTVACE